MLMIAYILLAEVRVRESISRMVRASRFASLPSPQSARQHATMMSPKRFAICISILANVAVILLLPLVVASWPTQPFVTLVALLEASAARACKEAAKQYPDLSKYVGVIEPEEDRRLPPGVVSYQFNLRCVNRAGSK